MEYTIDKHSVLKGWFIMNTESQQRLDAFEKMLSSIQAQYDDTLKKMERMKAEGRENSVTFRQMMGNKLQLQNMLSIYKLYGLVESKESFDSDG